MTGNPVQSKQWQTWNESVETVIIEERMAMKLGHNISKELCEPIALIIQEYGSFNFQ